MSNEQIIKIELSISEIAHICFTLDVASTDSFLTDEQRKRATELSSILKKQI